MVNEALCLAGADLCLQFVALQFNRLRVAIHFQKLLPVTLTRECV